MIMDEIIFNKLKWIKIKVPNGDILYFEDISAVQHYIAGKVKYTILDFLIYFFLHEGKIVKI